MIDLHCHIVNGVDDGSRNLEESVKMISAARDIGFDKICFTPHYMEDGYKIEKSDLESRYNIISEAVSKKILNMDLYMGQEVFITPDMAEHLDKYVCLNNSNFILFELPLVEDVHYLDDVIYKIQSMGKTPVLAHPERYMKSFENYDYLKTLAENGVLLQMNINSITGKYGKAVQKTALRLLQDDLITFVATDSHRVRDYEMAKQSLDVLKKLVGEKKFKLLTETYPSNILNNLDYDMWEGVYCKTKGILKFATKFPAVVNFLK